MPVKRTYFHRNFAIVHQVLATEQTDLRFDQFIVNRIGDPQPLFAKPTLEEAKLAVDELIAAEGGSAQRQPARASA